jgi:hypothetical protein
MIASVIPDLLDATQCRKIGDRIGENDFTGQRHSGGNARHVLFGDAYV